MKVFELNELVIDVKTDDVVRIVGINRQGASRALDLYTVQKEEENYDNIYYIVDADRLEKYEPSY